MNIQLFQFLFNIKLEIIRQQLRAEAMVRSDQNTAKDINKFYSESKFYDNVFLQIRKNYM